ncbi:peroxide stress protein YaaA [Massilia sp. TWP1-3-3]|uniref:peroxide stress protein YaaA n=1 Tax=Massilia sp. TWP1-3-3 TaxID=2804573 RepID=UPI003CFA320C
MIDRFDSRCLLIIPCCAAKKASGIPLPSAPDPLMACVSEDVYASVLNARARVLASTRADSRFMREKYGKNGLIRDGSDLGGDRTDGQYFTALDRYDGKLYRVPGFKQTVSGLASNASGAKIVILSALYGPLHPSSPIQDYNLMMSDAPARIWNEAFGPFLEDYVRQNDIARIFLYLGTSTAYFKVARKAIAGLLKAGRLAQAVQYHVVDGSTPTTPLQHGLRLLDDLDGRIDDAGRRSKGIMETSL